MSNDYFSRLAQRARGESPLVKPVISPMYAPTVALPGLSGHDLPPAEDPFESSAIEEVEEIEGGSHPVVSRTGPRPRFDSQPSEREHRSPPPIPPSAREWQRQTEAPRVEEDEVAPREPGVTPHRRATALGWGPQVNDPAPELDDIPGVAPPPAAAPPVRQVRPAVAPDSQNRMSMSESDVVRPSRVGRDVAIDIRPRQSQPPHDEPRQRQQASRGAQPGETAPPAPQVRVSIGRVEVRLITPPPAVQQSAPTAPRLSLDDYLRARNEGHR